MTDSYANYAAKFKEVTSTSIDDQAKFFLRSFVLDFQGRFEEVLDLAEEFKGFAPKEGVVRELEEDRAHYFLERRGETLTVVQLREYLKQIDLDSNHKVAFIEYILWKYKKNLEQLFNPPKGGTNAELLEALEKAIEEYQKVMAKRREREEKIKELEKLVALGGVKGGTAKHQLEQMKNDDKLEQNRREVSSEASKRKAQKAIEKDDPFAAEQKRLEAEKKKKEAEEKQQRDEARARLKDRAKAFS